MTPLPITAGHKIIDTSCATRVGEYAKQLKCSPTKRGESKSQNSATMESYSAIKTSKWLLLVSMWAFTNMMLKQKPNTTEWIHVYLTVFFPNKLLMQFPTSSAMNNLFRHIGLWSRILFNKNNKHDNEGSGKKKACFIYHYSASEHRLQGSPSSSFAHG